MLTTALDVLGAVLLITAALLLFGVGVAAAVAGALALAASWRLTRSGS